MLRHILLIAWYYLHWAEKRRGILFAHARQKNVSNRWYTPALLWVYANRKMAVVLTNFLAMFPFETCVKESENQPNGFVESRILVPRAYDPSGLRQETRATILGATSRWAFCLPMLRRKYFDVSNRWYAPALRSR